MVAFDSQREWEEWLDEHHAISSGIWMKIAKKGAGVDSIAYHEAVESALCYGWIDSQKVSHDDKSWLQRFTPRGRKSKWSRLNRDKVEDLLRRNRMRPAGIAQVEQARADGRWDAAYEPPSTATVPEDLQHALERNPSALAFFQTLNSANRYAILYRLQEAKRAETRAHRIQTFVDMLAENKKLYP